MYILICTKTKKQDSYCKQHNWHPAPYYLNSDNPFLTLRDWYCSSERDSNLGLQASTMFEHCWRLKPLGHHRWLYLLSKLFFCCQNFWHVNDVNTKFETFYVFKISKRHWERRMLKQPGLKSSAYLSQSSKIGPIGGFKCFQKYVWKKF